MNIRRLRLLLLLALAGLVGACAKGGDEAPPTRSSVSYRMDGSYHLPPSGQPSTSITVALPASDPPTTAPLALITTDTENFALAQGRIIVIGSQKSSRILARSTDSTAIDELLCDSSAIYAVHLNGTIERYSLGGNISWHAGVSAMPHIGTIIAGRTLVVMTDSEIFAYSTVDASVKWRYRSALEPVSLCFDNGAGILYAALSANQVTATDSIVCFDLSGKVTARAGFAKTRITSNLSICSDKGIAFGAISVADDKLESRMPHVALWSDLATAPKKLWDHQLPYIVSSVANDGELVLSSGFRETAGDLTSGIDAFRIADSSTLWQRRFSYPAVSQLGIGRGYAYIPFTFTTQATVPTKTIVMAIDPSDGKTATEFGVPGVAAGFVSGVGAPINGMLAYADRAAPKIYFLKP